MQCQKSTVELVPPGSILLGTNAMAKAKLSHLFQARLKPQEHEPVFPPRTHLAKKKLLGTAEGTAAGTGSRHRQQAQAAGSILTPRTPWPSGDRELASGAGRGAGCETAVRNNGRHKYRGNLEQRQ